VFNPTDKCPAFVVNPKIARRALEKQRADALEYAQLLEDSVPAAPIYSGLGGFDVPEYDFDELGYMNGVGYLTWGAAVRKYKSLPPAVRGPIFLRPSGSLYKPSDFDRAAEQL
jgi:hypothetical protein